MNTSLIINEGFIWCSMARWGLKTYETFVVERYIKLAEQEIKKAERLMEK